MGTGKGENKMSVIIQGMKMPKFGECIVITSDGVASKYLDGDVAMYYNAHPDKASAAELPPHGRLIDADEFFEECPELTAYEQIAETVIPADPEGGADG